jgi:hypothetical protein
MDKYGVEIDQEKQKTASGTKTCPKCGLPINEDDPPKCDKCGTEPFEKRTEEDGGAGSGAGL